MATKKKLPAFLDKDGDGKIDKKKGQKESKAEDKGEMPPKRGKQAMYEAMKKLPEHKGHHG